MVLIINTISNQDLSIRDSCLRNIEHINAYRHENLLETSHCPLVPESVEILAVGIAADDVLGQDHDEPLLQQKCTFHSQYFIQVM